MRVLIAEDDSLSRLITEAAVVKLGHAAVAVANGESAWTLLQQDAFDAVVSDRSMPLMDGIELCRRVRANHTGRYPYFIFLTSAGEKASIAEGMRAGADDYLVKPFEPDELDARLAVAERISSLHRKLADQQAELERLNRRLFEQARIDPLTNLGTRLRLKEDLEKLPARIARYSERYCALMCDVDYFKQYNDSYGHAAGDAVLRSVADAISGNLREGDQAYRYGGEEFLVLLRADSIRCGIAAAERCLAATEALHIPHHASPTGSVTMSIGVSLLADPSRAAIDTCLARADAALYRAKGAGRNQLSCDAHVITPPALPRQA